MRALGPRLTAVAAMTACGLLASTAPAWAGNSKTGATAAYGADISSPQCGSAYPSGVAFGIAGATGGRVFSQNSCLAGPSGELAWAAGAGTPGRAALYMNTADPSTLSPQWADPTGNPEGFADYTPTAPSGGWRPCDTTSDAGYGCDYDYGWNSAQYAYQQATSAASTSAVSAATLAAMPWWLDVETANSWTVNDSSATWNAQSADAADVQGAIDGLQAAGQAYAQSHGLSTGAPVVGIYTSPSAWQTLMGTATFSAPDWVPGARTQRAATSACAGSGPSGGQIQLSQWTGSYDYDVACTSAY